MDRALLALEGLSVGDAFGERFFVSPTVVDQLITTRALPRAPWMTTDDTEMAVAMTDVLERAGRIDQDLLARAFARRYDHDPRRGYGGGAHAILRSICMGVAWREAAAAAFNGMGSLGNGGAMRAAPLGAYFADDLATLVREARASAEVTHAHPEGQAGAIAAAVATAFAWRRRHDPSSLGGASLLSFVLDHTPDGETRAVIAQAHALPEGASVALAASALGTGNQVTAMDTVPFALWCAARCLDHYEDALWTTVSGLGDRDTTCAIVGGIVALSTGSGAIPAEWLAAREPLRRDPTLPASARA